MAAEKRRERFEDLYRRLEETVAKLEQGGLTLDETLALYEQGMGLAQRCQKMLQEAELKITSLKEAFAAYVAPEEEGEAESSC
jgi:exodeoxyribonuclease VII small subunit